MHVVVTSDFHGHLPADVPPCDLLLIAGDCLDGDRDELERWFTRQPAEAIVGVAGNHDFIAEEDEQIVRGLPWTYLRNEATVVHGVPVWGSPMSLRFMDWAFMARDDELAAIWATIPDDTEIVIVHGPAFGILDRTSDGRHVGSVTLRERLDELPRLRLLATGHVHEAYGETAFVRSAAADAADWIRCVNGSFLDASYQLTNPPIEIDL